MKEKIKKINELIQKHDVLRETINYGGCGVFAYLMLKKVKGIKVVYLDMFKDFENKNEIVSNLRYCKKERNLIVSCGHIMLKYDKYYFDAKTIGKTLPNRYINYKKYILDIDAKLMKNALDMKEQWNSSYNRNFNSILGKIINQCLLR